MRWKERNDDKRGSERAESGNAIQEEALINEATPVRNLLRCRDVCSLQVPSASNTPLPVLNTDSIRPDGASSSSAADSMTGREVCRNSLSSSLLSFSVEVITTVFVLTNWGHSAQLILPKLNVLLAGKIHLRQRCSEKIGY